MFTSVQTWSFLFELKRAVFLPSMLSGKKKAQYMPKLPNAELLSQPVTSVSNKGRKRKKRH